MSRTSNSLNVNFTVTFTVTFCIILDDSHNWAPPTRPVDGSDPCPTLWYGTVSGLNARRVLLQVTWCAARVWQSSSQRRLHRPPINVII